jgi:hypothetical protein
MTKMELTELIRSDMFEAVKQRDRTDPKNYEEEYGYFNGQYRAYESVLKLLMMFDIYEITAGDFRSIRR